MDAQVLDSATEQGGAFLPHHVEHGHGHVAGLEDVESDPKRAVEWIRVRLVQIEPTFDRFEVLVDAPFLY